MYVFEYSSPSSLKPGKTRHSIPREIPRNGNQIRAVTSQERTPHSIPREIPRSGNQIRSVTSLERTLHAIAPWEAQLSIPAKGDRPCPPPSCGGQRPPRSRACQRRRPAARRGRPRDASPSISPSARNVVAGANGILKVPTQKLLPSLSSFVGTTAFSYLLRGRPL